MAHELEIDPATGRAAHVSGWGIDPWHRLGTVLPAGLTADEALEKAFLRDWGITKEQVYVYLEETSLELGVGKVLVPVPGQFTIVRSNPFTKKREILGAEVRKTSKTLDDGSTVEEEKIVRPGGSVGQIYTPFQNEEGVEFLAAITDEYGEAEFETAGSIRGGTQTFVTMRLKGFKVAGVDDHVLYLVYLFNHLTGSNQVFPTHIRVVCANTADAAIASAKFVFRHSKSIGDRHQQARDALRMTFDYSGRFQLEAEEMVKIEMGLDEFRKVCDEIWTPLDPEAKDKIPEAAFKKEAARNYQLKQLFLFSDTQEEIRGTRWAAYNTLTEYMDHFTSTRGATEKEKAEARAYRTIDGIDLKEKAYSLLRVR